METTHLSPSLRSSTAASSSTDEDDSNHQLCDNGERGLADGARMAITFVYSTCSLLQ